jgi:hypothetical protein
LLHDRTINFYQKNIHCRLIPFFIQDNTEGKEENAAGVLLPRGVEDEANIGRLNAKGNKANPFVFDRYPFHHLSCG